MTTINELLALTLKRGASDLHLSAGLAPILRIDGDLVTIEDSSAISATELHSMLCGIMNNEQQAEFKENLEIDFATEIPTLGRFRVNAFNQTRGCAAAFRAIPSDIPTLDTLGLPALLKQFCELPRGLILVTGPTGSGKSTTLAAMIDYINMTMPSHVITIEDPVEFTHASRKALINQREVHWHTHSFSAALRSALREDPDIILVGEMRDLETIRLALTAAETGHLVLATVHTSSAAKTINRIVDVFPAEEKNVVRSQLSEAIQAVVCQTLVKKINGGRTAALEVMVGTKAIRNLIREDKIPQMYSAIQTGASVGMRTLDQHLQELVQNGIIAPETAHEVAVDRDK